MKESGKRTLLFSSRSLYNVIEDENSLFLFFLPHQSCCIPLAILITGHCLVGTRVNCFSYAFRLVIFLFFFTFLVRFFFLSVPWCGAGLNFCTFPCIRKFLKVFFFLFWWVNFFSRCMKMFFSYRLLYFSCIRNFLEGFLFLSQKLCYCSVFLYHLVKFVKVRGTSTSYTTFVRRTSLVVVLNDGFCPPMSKQCQHLSLILVSLREF